MGRRDDSTKDPRAASEPRSPSPQQQRGTELDDAEKSPPKISRCMCSPGVECPSKKNDVTKCWQFGGPKPPCKCNWCNTRHKAGAGSCTCLQGWQYKVGYANRVCKTRIPRR